MSYAPTPPAPATAGNLYLEGPFAPVPREETHADLHVEGTLPVELDGLYVRNGPNPFKRPDPRRHHWFVGDGMVHGIRLQAGRALWYRNRWVGGNRLHAALGRPHIAGQPRGLFDTVNTNVYAHAGRLWASVEAGPYPIELDPELGSRRHGLFDSALDLPFSAHPHRDPISGDLHAVCYDARRLNRLYYMRVSARGQVDRTVEIPVKGGPMVHDCAITRSQVIVLDLPVTFSFKRLLQRAAFPYAWNPRHPARVGLLPREGDARDIRWYAVDPCYVFHPCNAYDDEDGSVVLDVVVHPRMFDRSRIGPEGGRAPTFERWRLPAGGHDVRREVISDIAQEFPRLDESRVAQRYRYAYAVEFTVDAAGGQRLLKHDLDTRRTQAHHFTAERKPGEFVYVPRRASGDEDDGWLLGYAFNLARGRGELHVIDARRIDAPAVAIVHVPAPVPMGFHGNWIDIRELGGA